MGVWRTKNSWILRCLVPSVRVLGDKRSGTCAVGGVHTHIEPICYKLQKRKLKKVWFFLPEERRASKPKATSENLGFHFRSLLRRFFGRFSCENFRIGSLSVQSLGTVGQPYLRERTNKDSWKVLKQIDLISGDRILISGNCAVRQFSYVWW